MILSQCLSLVPPTTISQAQSEAIVTGAIDSLNRLELLCNVVDEIGRGERVCVYWWLLLFSSLLFSSTPLT
eukprot:GABW01004147.1.p1 GENE.GABW01004147.1~~GABW01004147.1.p1  ORF type:complete len:71 (-),score=9.25 GABW01004147.1:89-301(-)